MRNAGLDRELSSVAEWETPPPPQPSERSLLADEAADARLAMTQTIAEMGQTLKTMLDVSPCIRQHPWLTTGSAAAAGLIVGAAWPAIDPTAGHDASPSSGDDAQPECREKREKIATTKSFWVATAGTLVRGLLQAVVENSIAAAAEKPSQDSMRPAAAEKRTD